MSTVICVSFCYGAIKPGRVLCRQHFCISQSLHFTLEDPIETFYVARVYII